MELKKLKIEFIAVKTPVIASNTKDLSEIILSAIKANNIELQDSDIIIIASKIISMVEGCQVPLNSITCIREDAKLAAEKAKLIPQFVELIFEEADEIIGAVPGAVLALKENILQANAGVDQSNAGGESFFIKLPRNPIKTIETLLENITKITGKIIGIIIADSKTHPLRRGTSGFALAVAGFIPIIDDRGSHDIFGRPMRITTRAIADNLACGAEILMGESDQKVPVVIARGCTDIVFKKVKDPIENNNLMKMSPERCIYMGPLWNSNKNKMK